MAETGDQAQRAGAEGFALATIETRAADLYDLSYARGPEHDSAGIGRWGLMGWGVLGWLGVMTAGLVVLYGIGWLALWLLAGDVPLPRGT